MKHSMRILPALLLALILALTPILAHAPMLISTMPISEMTFSDMPDDYSTEALKFAVEEGYLVGMDGMLKPNDSITNAQVATVLGRAANLSGMADMSGYQDVPADMWYYPAMATAMENGLLMDKDGMLYPNSPATREAAFYALAMALDIEGDTMSVLDRFTDKDMLDMNYATPVAALVQAGIVEGYNNMMMPKAEITRKDFAVILYRAMEYDTMHTVTFQTAVTHSFSGEETITMSKTDVLSGAPVAMPVEPVNTVTIDGIDVDKWYDLRAWYTDPALMYRWDFSTPIEKNMTLYAEFVHVPDPPTNTHFSFINDMFVDSDGVVMVQGVEDGHEYGPIPLKEGLVIEQYMADSSATDAGVYLAYTIGDRMVADAVPVPAAASGTVNYISAEGVRIGDGEMMMFDAQIYMYWAHADGTYSVYNKVAGRFPVEEMTAEHLPLGTYVSLFDARGGSTTFAEGKIDAIIVREGAPAPMTTLTLDELAMYNGKDDMPAYIAIDGMVYDVSAHMKWMEGMHGGQMAGTDVTEAFRTMGHNDNRFESLPLVGMLKP